jgi:hypothetical protein
LACCTCHAKYNSVLPITAFCCTFCITKELNRLINHIVGGLTDIFTIWENIGKLEDVTLAYVGDQCH